MRIGVPPNSENCLDAAGFLFLASEAGAMRVPRPAAGMMTTTFMAGCKYKAYGETCSNVTVQRNYDLVAFGGSHNSTRFPSGSVIQAKRPHVVFTVRIDLRPFRF